ncbi:MAG: hypothetical protein ABIC68_01100 [Candidatus Omnitrophota bacterium]
MLYLTASNFIFLPIIILLGVITSLEDFRYNLIKNKWIVLSLAYVVLIYLSFFLASLFPNASPVYRAFFQLFDRWCINLAVSIIVSYALWKSKTWSAGDAKLFIAFCALLPLGIYRRVYFHYYFASFYFLLAIFIPATVYIFLRTFFSVITQDERKVHLLSKLQQIKKSNKFDLFKISIGFCGFFLFFRILRTCFESFIFINTNNQTIAILISLLLFKKITKFLKNKWRFVLIGIVILMAYEICINIHTPDRFFSTIVGISFQTIVLLIIRSLLNNFIGTYGSCGDSKKENKCFAHWIFLGALITWFLKIN